MKRKHMYFGSTAALICLLALTACGAGAKSHKSPSMTAAAYDMAAAETTAYEEVSENSASQGSGGGLSDTTATTQALPTGRKLIRNAELTVETDAFDQLITTLTAQVSELGGYVEQSSISGNSLNHQNEPIPRYAYLTARVPSDKLDGFISTVEGSSNVTNKSESTQDVTLQYSDLESRKKSLTVEQDRIWALLEKADTLEAVIALESRLSEIRYQLESMESQLRLYDNQVDYSTVHLSINEIRGSAAFTPTEPETFGQRIQNGFSRNLKAVSRGLTNFFIWLITASPFWIPLALVIILILFLGRNRRRKHRSALPAPAAPPEPSESPESPEQSDPN